MGRRCIALKGVTISVYALLAPSAQPPLGDVIASSTQYVLKGLRRKLYARLVSIAMGTNKYSAN